jgi:hypothetical protein
LPDYLIGVYVETDTGCFEGDPNPTGNELLHLQRVHQSQLGAD